MIDNNLDFDIALYPYELVTYGAVSYTHLDVYKRQVSECTGAAVDTLYSMQTVSRADFDAGETYLTLMERNYEDVYKRQPLARRKRATIKSVADFRVRRREIN